METKQRHEFVEECLHSSADATKFTSDGAVMSQGLAIAYLDVHYSAALLAIALPFVVCPRHRRVRPGCQ